jgi:hypothetical protein
LAHALFAAIILSGYALLTKYLLTLMADPRDRLIIAQQECENAEKEARKKIDKRLIDLSAASSGTPDND